jgi:hypothetical protein
LKKILKWANTPAYFVEASLTEEKSFNLLITAEPSTEEG